MGARLDAHAGYSVAMFRDSFFVSLPADHPDTSLGAHAPARVSPVFRLPAAVQNTSSRLRRRSHHSSFEASIGIVKNAATHRVASLASHHLPCQTHCEVAGLQASPRSS
jgi:hypothetical protein